MKGLHIRWGMNVGRAPVRTNASKKVKDMNTYHRAIEKAQRPAKPNDVCDEWNRLDRERHALEMLQRDADTCKYCHRHFADCNCDYCEIDGHKWSLAYAVQGELFVACLNCGEETSYFSVTKSWRAEIVEEAIREDNNHGK